MGSKVVVTVVGMKKFHGSVKDKQTGEVVHIHQATFFALLPMEPVDKKDESQELGRKGSMVVEYKTDDFRLYDSLKADTFPVQVELELETFATGQGKTKEVLVAVSSRGVKKVA